MSATSAVAAMMDANFGARMPFVNELSSPIQPAFIYAARAGSPRTACEARSS
jgi:hypothetical protein